MRIIFKSESTHNVHENMSVPSQQALDNEIMNMYTHHTVKAQHSSTMHHHTKYIQRLEKVLYIFVPVQCAAKAKVH